MSSSITRTRTRLLIVIVGASLLASACGIDPDTKREILSERQGGGVVIDPTTGEVLGPESPGEPVIDPATGEVIVPGSAGGDTDPSKPGTQTGPGKVAGPTKPGTKPTTTTPTNPKPGAPAPGAAPLGPDSKVGIDERNKTIKIYLHGPLTGAGVPQDSFKSGTPKYWDNNGKPRRVKGYRVIAEAVDDKYQPGAAVKACNARAKDGFLIIGGAGTDQIQACARSSVLARGNVPYLSAGVTENGLGGLPNYFATSLTYAQQARLVVEMARKGNYLAPANGKGWAVVVSNTPNFTDAEQAIVSELRKAGQSAKVIRVPKTGGDAGGVASQLREGQYQSVYFLGQPLFFIELTGRTGCPAYCPQWAGVGVSMGVNTIGSQACNVTGRQYKGEFLNPTPGLDQAAKLAPGVSFRDDVEFGIYGSMQTLEQMLNSVPGEGFTRESFIAAVDGSSYPGGIFPSTSFKGDRFGGSAAYALRMDCGKGQHVTTGRYS